MIRRIDLRGGPRRTASDYRNLVPRSPFDVDAAADLVRPTLAEIREHGDAAVLACARRDAPELTAEGLAVPVQATERALAALAPDVRAACEESIRRLQLASQAELEQDTVVSIAPGATVTQRMVPYHRVGVYVPAGVTALPSTVLMTVVPAQVAGVSEIALASPALPEFGSAPHPTVLALAALLGITEVYAVGGVGAVGMFAYGTDRCAPTEFVAGPGRITTVAAKRLVRGLVGIDSEAGPTEIAVLADDSARPELVAADLISQAEHDEMAASVLITASERLADAVAAQLAVQVPESKHASRIAAALDGEQSGIVLVDDLDRGLEVTNAYAAEHVEIHTENPAEVAARVRNAGAIFVGSASPVSLGDYCAGSNHVLPTGGCACHSSGLSVRSYTKAVHVVQYDQRALEQVAEHVQVLAEAEDLPAHGMAVRRRLEADGPGASGTASGRQDNEEVDG